MKTLKTFVKLVGGTLRVLAAVFAALHALFAFLSYFGPSLNVSPETVGALGRFLRGAEIPIYKGPLLKSVFGGVVDYNAILNAFIFLGAYFVVDWVTERVLVKVAGAARPAGRAAPATTPEDHDRAE